MTYAMERVHFVIFQTWVGTLVEKYIIRQRHRTEAIVCAETQTMAWRMDTNTSSSCMSTYLNCVHKDLFNVVSLGRTYINTVHANC